jgi:NAD(P)-dependent dehydrogenase (short-subunit alcohol dehydrogenase family)
VASDRAGRVALVTGANKGLGLAIARGLAVTNAMLPLLRRPGHACIVNVTSDLGSLAHASADPSFPQLLAYNTSKAALNAVTVTYANELREEGVLVNAVSPGSVATDQNGHQGF